MATVILDTNHSNAWQPPHPTENEMPADSFDRLITQAEALAQVVVCEDFRTFPGVIQNNVLWLLSNLVTESRIAAEEMRAQAKAAEATNVS